MPYSHLRFEERYVIYHLSLVGLSLREIARRLGRHHTTIGRELSRNGPRHGGGAYIHEVAQRRAADRWRVARHRRRRSHGRLYRYVVRGLERDWSPEQIAGRLERDHRDDGRMRVSPETIYLWIYREAATGGRLFSHLRRGHKKRRKQRRQGSGRGLIPGRIGIDQRPPVAGRRQRLGDWEGDTLEGAKGGGGLASHVERSTLATVGKITSSPANTARITAKSEPWEEERSGAKRVR